jgi:ABC-2 type transport system ATP-binding protein
VAILNTTLQTIGRPAELRDRLFSPSLVVRTRAALPHPEQVFEGQPGVDKWKLLDEPSDGHAGVGYDLTVSDAELAAPAVIRALVAAGADVLAIAQERHSLEDVYLELVDQDVEVTGR